jgi:hypothetical protein
MNDAIVAIDIEEVVAVRCLALGCHVLRPPKSGEERAVGRSICSFS